MKYMYLLSLLLFASCEDWYGKPVPLGDEFEDRWYVLDSLQEQIKYLCTSNTVPECFFAISANQIWQVKDTLVQIADFDLELTCLAASFSSPEQLLAGTTSSVAILIDAAGNTSEITVPGINHISFVAFDPLDTMGIYAGDDNVVLLRDSSGANFDTVFYSPDDILDFIVSHSGTIYIATAGNIFLSADYGTNWDTIYSSAGTPISQITLDLQENLYVHCGNTVYQTTDKTNWTTFYDDATVWESIAGIVDGIIIAREVEARKITKSDEGHDISHGIVVDFGYSSALITVNGSKYLMASLNMEWEKTIFFFFDDTELPP